MRRRILTGIIVVALLAVAGSAGAVVRPAQADPAPVVVTLGFDDGNLDQFTKAFPLLQAHGLHATFFINTGFIETADHMTWQDLHDMQAAGNEIAGHTLTHKNLKHLKPDALRQQICQDRVNLFDQGFQPVSFAYPFGAWDADVRQTVIDCGYNSARTVSGGTETIPPLDAWATRTPPNPKKGTTVATLQSYVTDAQTSGGGWVQYVFHHVCKKCDAYAIKPSNLDKFLAWLAAQPGVTVETTAQVIGGPVLPPVAP